MTMRTCILDLAEFYDVTANGATVRIETAELSDAMIGLLFKHGLTQKVADAAAGAKKVSEADDETRDKTTIAFDLMSKVKVNLESGTWGATRGESADGDGLSDLERMIVVIATENLPIAQWKAKIEHWSSMTTAERRSAKWAILQGNVAMAKLEELAKERMAQPTISI